jgi:hypothetical protein
MRLNECRNYYTITYCNQDLDPLKIIVPFAFFMLDIGIGLIVCLKYHKVLTSLLVFVAMPTRTEYHKSLFV